MNLDVFLSEISDENELVWFDFGLKFGSITHLLQLYRIWIPSINDNYSFYFMEKDNRKNPFPNWFRNCHQLCRMILINIISQWNHPNVNGDWHGRREKKIIPHCIHKESSKVLLFVGFTVRACVFHLFVVVYSVVLWNFRWFYNDNTPCIQWT